MFLPIVTFSENSIFLIGPFKMKFIGPLNFISLPILKPNKIKINL